MRAMVGDAVLDQEAGDMERNFLDLRERLMGNRTRRAMGDHGPVSVERRINVVVIGAALSTYGPTPTHLRSLEIAREELALILTELERLAGTDLPALEKRLDAAGVPWTPGRGVTP